MGYYELCGNVGKYHTFLSTSVRAKAYPPSVLNVQKPSVGPRDIPSFQSEILSRKESLFIFIISMSCYDCTVLITKRMPID